MKSKLGIILIAAIASLVILAIATAPDQKPIREDALGFHVQESDELYFKNLRRYYYEHESREDAQFELLRLKQRWADIPDLKQRSLFFTLVNNPRLDEAYIMVEWNDAPLEGELEVEIVGGESDRKFSIGPSGMDAHQLFAVQVYATLAEQGLSYQVTYQGKRDTIWISESDRKKVKTVLSDYFNLVSAF